MPYNEYAEEMQLVAAASPPGGFATTEQYKGEDDALYIKQESAWQLLLQFVPPDGPASEHQSVQRVTEAVQKLGLPPPQMERIEKAVMEALRKATKRGHQDQPDLPVTVRVWISDAYTEERSRSNPNDEQGGRQERRGWGFFLIQKQEDGPQASDEGSHHLVELFLYQERVLPEKKRQRG